MKIKNYFVAFVILFIVWTLINNTLDITILLIGFGLSLILSFFFCQKCNLFSEIRLTPKAILYTFIYLFVFIGEMIKSNIDVARRVVSPSLPINPGIVEVKTVLTSKMGRLILANSITLTPGTFTIEINEEKIYIHWIEVETHDSREATQKIVRKFEKYLEVMYG